MSMLEHRQDAFAQWVSLVCNPSNERTDRELVQMSDDDRSRVFADIGGVQEINPEDPDFVNQCLHDLDEAIQRVQTKYAFIEAQRINPHYTNNPGFRLMFLRADSFNIESAATRIVNHFAEKLELFGPERVARDITLGDLNGDDLECLLAGGIQWLPRPDKFGRAILCSRQVFWKYKHRENLRRSLWYMVMALMEDADIQRRGIVAIGYSIGSFHRGKPDLEMHRQFVKTGSWLPMKVTAVYMCFSNPRFVSIADVVTHMFNSFLRVRFRPIQGTRQECDYQLMLMGINHKEIPAAQDDADLLIENHLAWIRNRRDLEEARAAAILRLNENQASVQDPMECS